MEVCILLGEEKRYLAIFFILIWFSPGDSAQISEKKISSKNFLTQVLGSHFDFFLTEINSLGVMLSLSRVLNKR